MRTFGEMYGTEGTFKDRNPLLKCPNHRLDHLVTCPECGQGMPLTDVLSVRNHMACPFCQRFIDHVSDLVIGQRRDEE